MDSRLKWLFVRLVLAVVVVGWGVSYLFPSRSAEKEFQKTLDAMKQVRSAHVVSVADPYSTQHIESSWDLVCAQDAYRYKMHVVQSGPENRGELENEELHVGAAVYQHRSDDSWRPQINYGMSPTTVCRTLAQGAETGILPDIATMIKRGILDKGDKKVVDGVRCREWKVTMRGGPTGLEHDTVCLGLDDYLPYEMTVDWTHSRTTYSDYNSSTQLDLPSAALQPASANSGSN